MSDAAVASGATIRSSGVLGWRNHSSNSFNGWATPKFDKDRGQAIIDISDFGSMLHGEPSPGSSYDDFFQHLWGLLIEQIERM